MKESIKITVLSGKDEIERELEILYEDNVIEFHFEGSEVFSGDFNGNFAEAFTRALELWSIDTSDKRSEVKP